MTRPRKAAPNVFELDQEAEGRYEPFYFTGPDSEGAPKEFELPNPQLLAPEDIRKALEVPDRLSDDFDLQDYSPRELMMALAPDAWRSLRQASGYAQNAIIDQWVDHCEIALDSGKGLSPSSAPNHAARRSKRT